MTQEPVTHRIAAELRQKIQEGSLGPGALLPSEPELAQKYGVRHQNARSALKALEQEGLIVVHSTRGRTVRNRPPLRRVSSTPRHASHRESGRPEFDTEALAQGQAPSRRMLKVGRDTAPADVTRWLGIA